MKFILTSDNHYIAHMNDIQVKFFEQIKKDIEEDPDIKFITFVGDQSSSRLAELPMYFQIFRGALPDLPTYWVKGNHDFWDPKGADMSSFGEALLQHKEMCEAYRIKHLDAEVEVIPYRDEILHEDKTLALYGFDGWYGNPNPPSNDINYMRYKMEEGQKPILHHMYNKAKSDFQKVLDLRGVTEADNHVLITHFPPFSDRPRVWGTMCASFDMMNPILKNFDIFCVGHSHQHVVAKNGNCRIFNCGSDYNDPKYMVIEVDMPTLGEEE